MDDFNVQPQPGLDLLLRDAPEIKYEVCHCWPHDREAFTEGLSFHNGYLYESTGHRGSSSLRRVELKTGRVLDKRHIDEPYFAEGLTIFDGKIFQLTWTNEVCFVYDLQTFCPLIDLSHDGWGWGLTNDGHQLILSKGLDNQLYYTNPIDFKPSGRKPIDVTFNSSPVNNLNELEYIKGSIYANVFGWAYIVRVEPKNGIVTGKMDLTALKPPDVDDPNSLLNGIAYDQNSGHLFVTGKNWPALFEINLLN